MGTFNLNWPIANKLSFHWENKCFTNQYVWKSTKSVLRFTTIQLISHLISITLSDEHKRQSMLNQVSWREFDLTYFLQIYVKVLSTRKSFCKHLQWHSHQQLSIYSGNRFGTKCSYTYSHTGLKPSSPRDKSQYYNKGQNAAWFYSVICHWVHTASDDQWSLEVINVWSNAVGR